MPQDSDQFLRDSVEGLVRKSPLGVYTDTMDRLGGTVQDAFNDGKRAVKRWFTDRAPVRPTPRGDIQLPDERKPRRAARRSGR